MATRENQGLQISLIVSVIIIVGLLVILYFFWSQGAEATRRADSAASNLQTTQDAQRTTLAEFNQVKVMLGHPEDAAFDEIQKSFDNSMTMFADNIPKESRSLFDLIDFLYTELQKRNTQLADALERENKLTANLEQVRQEEKGISVKYEQGQKESDDKLKQELASYTQQIKRVNDEKSQFNDQLQKKGQQIAKITADSQDTIATLNKNVDTLNLRVEGLQSILDGLKVETHRDPHGKVVWVNQRKGVIYVNLGADDGLRPQITFTVLDQNVNKVKEDAIKGSVEVTRIINGHLAEAKIVRDDIANLMLPGDKVYSPVWTPGGFLRFALAGNLDLDDDTKSDRDKLRDIITLNRGVIDAEMDDAGKISGKLTLQTRYLVLGEAPTDESAKDYGTAWTTMIEEARRLGVELIGLDELLGLMGWKEPPKAEKIGKSRRADNYPPTDSDDAEDSSTDNGNRDAPFRERRPG